MKQAKFNYRKNENEDMAKRTILLVENTDTHMKGFDAAKLSDAEKVQIHDAYNELNMKLKPYMKAFRSFKKKKADDIVIASYDVTSAILGEPVDA